jgi:hypothetical protein
MTLNFIIFSVETGTVRSLKPLPDYFHRVARDAYVAIRDEGKDVEQSRIAEMATACLRILQLNETQYDSAQPVDHEVVCLAGGNRASGEVEDLIERLCRYDHETRRFRWVDVVVGGETLQPSQMMAAYAFHRIDVAAAAYLADDKDLALQALAEACEAASNYGFHGGYDDRDEMVKSAGSDGSFKRWEPMKEVRERVVARWQEEPQRWRSMRHCAHSIEQEILAFAASKGIKMSADNAQRTIYDWIRASKKHTG